MESEMAVASRESHFHGGKLNSKRWGKNMTMNDSPYE